LDPDAEHPKIELNRPVLGGFGATTPRALLKTPSIAPDPPLWARAGEMTAHIEVPIIKNFRSSRLAITDLPISNSRFWESLDEPMIHKARFCNNLQIDAIVYRNGAIKLRCRSAFANRGLG
jgi:hypothetical protein